MNSQKQTFDFDTPIDRRKSNSLKWGSRTVNKENLTPLSVADMDFSIDAHILEAMSQRMEHPIFGYEFTPDTLDDAFTAWQLRQHNFHVDKNCIVHLPGVVTGLAISILAFSEHGDGVVIQPPVYPPFFGVVENNDRKLLLNPLLYNSESATWTMDLSSLEELFVQESPKIMLLCNPHNPVGRVWKKAELRALGDLCHRHEVMLLSDDIHADFIFSGHTYTPLAEAMKQEQQNFVQLLSPSKTFNISGLAMAFALVPDAKQRKILQNKIAAMGLSKINTMASTAVQAAYTHGEQWFNAVLAYIEENHQLFREQMTDGLPWIKISAVEGSFVAWVDLQKSDLSHAELKHIIRHEAKLMLFEGLSFGENGEYFFRFNLACPRTILQGAINAFVQALKTPKKREPLELNLDNVIDRRCCG